MSPNIRVATSIDAHDLTTLGITTFVDAFAHHNTAEDMDLYVTGEMNVEKIEAELLVPDNIFFMAYVGDALAGYAKVRSVNPPPELNGVKALEIERLYVLKQFQNKHIGLALLEHCISFARSKLCSIIWLGVWEHNHGAIRFYERIGFSRFGAHGFRLGNDDQTDILMKKDI